MCLVLNLNDVKTDIIEITNAGMTRMNANATIRIPINLSIHNKIIDADTMMADIYCTITQLLVGGDCCILSGFMTGCFGDVAKIVKRCELIA